MRLIRHPEADDELADAALYYEREQPGLGEDFLTEFEVALRQILVDPFRSRIVYGNNRKLNLRRFPYGIVYSVKNDAIFLKAAPHLHRRPFYWQTRR